MSAGYFTWVRGMRGPEPKKWDELPRLGCEYWRPGKPDSRILRQHALSAEEWKLSLDELVAKYPAPETAPEGDKIVLTGAASGVTAP